MRPLGAPCLDGIAAFHHVRTEVHRRILGEELVHRVGPAMVDPPGHLDDEAAQLVVVLATQLDTFHRLPQNR